MKTNFVLFIVGFLDTFIAVHELFFEDVFAVHAAEYWFWELALLWDYLLEGTEPFNFGADYFHERKS